MDFYVLPFIISTVYNMIAAYIKVLHYKNQINKMEFNAGSKRFILP
jgi:hypothetical protein